MIIDIDYKQTKNDEKKYMNIIHEYVRMNAILVKMMSILS